MQNATKDLQTLLMCEKAFLSLELNFCPPLDKMAFTSLTNTIASADDALLALQAVGYGSTYEIANMTHPRLTKYRVKGMPKDSFHVFCVSHGVRIDNIMCAPGIHMLEKSLLAQRRANLATAQAAYLDKQKEALTHVSHLTTP
jgi:hypothetical protein